jgi:hypothetical protein
MPGDQGDSRMADRPAAIDDHAAAVTFVTFGTMAFACLHFLWYSRVVAYWLWGLSGGIVEEGRLTHFGAADWAWTVPLHLPAGILFQMNAVGLGFLLILGGSLVAGFAAANLLVGFFGERQRLGFKQWRLWLFLGGWAWMPVPSTMSWVYQWTVVY